MQKARVVEVYRKAIESLYSGLATVIVRETVRDTVTKVSSSVEKTIYEDIPCRLSFSTAKNQEDLNLVTLGEGNFTLFTSPEIDIPVNSKIVVIQNNYSYNLLNSKKKSYASHNEYSCVEFVRWA